MQGLRYTSRGLRRRNNTDKREVTLSHVDPVTGETARTFRTVGAKTKKGAEKARDALIVRLESDGGAVGSSMTVREFMEQFLRYKEASGTIEPSTVRSYRGEAKQIYPALGAIRLAELTSADVDRWMAGMTAEGYAPKTVAKPFRLLKQALKWAVGQDLLTKNACDFCKPPKRAKTPINALSREDRSRMLALTGAEDGQLGQDDPPHEEHLREAAGMAQGGRSSGPASSATASATRSSWAPRSPTAAHTTPRCSARTSPPSAR